MSADLLRKAAKRMRAAGGAWLAVADWLEEEADAWSEEGGDGLPYFRAYMVAVTYLGTDA